MSKFEEINVKNFFYSGYGAKYDRIIYAKYNILCGYNFGLCNRIKSENSIIKSKDRSIRRLISVNKMSKNTVLYNTINFTSPKN